MKVNGEAVRCLSLRIYNENGGEGKLEIYTKEPEPHFHFDKCEFEIYTLDSKKLAVTGAFFDAEQQKKLYHYIFNIEKYNEFYV